MVSINGGEESDLKHVLLLMLLQIGSVNFDRAAIADHASNLAKNIQGNLKRSLEALGVVSAGSSGADQQDSRATSLLYPKHFAKAERLDCSSEAPSGSVF